MQRLDQNVIPRSLRIVNDDQAQRPLNLGTVNIVDSVTCRSITVSIMQYTMEPLFSTYIPALVAAVKVEDELSSSSSRLFPSVMPSHTASSALVKLFDPTGAPWEWPAWQDRTGVLHGLFPEDDKHLPYGWTRQNAIDIQSYFRAYHLLPTEEKKMAFAAKTKGGSAHPGRELWNNWVMRRWNAWGIHDIVVQELKEAEIHPLNIIVRENDPSAPWPTSDFYIPMILDSLALRLFGEEAFPSGAGVLTTNIRKCIHIIAQKSWNTIRVQVGVLKNRPNEIMATALAAFKDLENGKPTKAKVSRAIWAVSKWKSCAQLYNTPDNVKAAEDMLAELQAILEALGAKIKKRVEPAGICKVSTVDLKGLATEEDVSDLLALYDEYFDQDAEDQDEPPISDALPDKQQLNDCGGDFGMELEAKMTPASLALSLGFKTGLPPSFNLLRDRSGISPWDDPLTFADPKADPLPCNLSKLCLHWHQLAGVHSIVRSIFTEVADPSHTTGVLVGDEVGLGKTAQAISTIAFLMQVIRLQETKRKLPRLIAKRCYLGGSDNIPSLPHLILCPGTLIAQWVSELKVLLRPKSVDIFVYESQSDSRQFWSSSSAFQQSKHKPHNRIVVMSHSALFNDMNSLHQNLKKKKGGPRPWDIPSPKGPLTETIFEQHFLTTIVDEAHHMRNIGKRHSAVLRILQQTKLRLIMTATPLHTSSKDIASMGRLVGIPHFFTEESHIEEKADAAAVRKAKKLDDDGEALLVEQLQSVKRLQAHLVGHFLRRTTASLDFIRKPLLPSHWRSG
ncbi:hypothetical protein D9615_010044 [Tricholomella constricta]|uniref:Helicase ATP-binding domain-containing protein n=1 Tax=Tricholomella constricta TaxID=117010 RepID=A0A8H5GU07_9AGAR|nr:hypothetical protein D9615_010044 [Tricholomella constricta]